MKRAIFFDRDGVINELVLNPKTGEYEPPKCSNDLRLYSYSIKCLKSLQQANYELFLVSNQPDYAKGKVSLQNLFEVNQRFVSLLASNGVTFRDIYYCYHHPAGIIRKYSFECECRKPKPFFLLKAKEEYNLDLKSSWMIGDRDSDILCGRAAGVKTILIDEPKSAAYRGTTKPDYTVKDLSEGTKLILENRIE